jgi:transposase
MTRPFSLDLRERVARFVVSGGTTREAAERFAVSVTAAGRWARRLRETGSAAPFAMGGTRRAVLAGERDWLLARIAETPDLTLRAIQAELAERGVVVSYDAVWRFYRQAGVTFKKKPVRRRAGPTGRGPKARALEAVSGPA